MDGRVPVSVRFGTGAPWCSADAVDMRFIHLFLVGYVILILGVGLALWQTGMLSRLAPIWVAIGALISIGVGIMLSVSAGKPALSEEVVKP
jgi:hypothetical protein